MLFDKLRSHKMTFAIANDEINNTDDDDDHNNNNVKM